MMKNLKYLFVIPLLFIVGFFILFFRMGYNDSRALAGFSDAYEQYDRAIADYSNSVKSSSSTAVDRTGLRAQADEKLAELNHAASARISSLTVHDGDIMRVNLEIAALSEKELVTLKTLESASAAKQADADQLSKELDELTQQRQAAFAQFVEYGNLEK
jgi:hypothetical protein